MYYLVSIVLVLISFRYTCSLVLRISIYLIYEWLIIIITYADLLVLCIRIN